MYGKIITLGESAFKAKAEEAIEKQPLRKNVFMSEVDIVDFNKIRYRGIELKMTEQAMTQLLKVLKIPKQFIYTFSKLLEQKPEARRSFINTIKNVMSGTAKGTTSIVLLLSAATREVIGIRQRASSVIGNKFFLDVVERIVDENELDVVDFSISGTGSVNINALNMKKEFNVKGLSDEYFKSGVSFMNNPSTGLTVAPYINRLICANGMIGRGFEDTVNLKSTETQFMSRFFEDIEVLSKSGFKPTHFTENVEQAMSVNSSVSELIEVKKIIKNVTDITPEELEPWVPVKYVEKAYNRINVDINLLNSSQRKNAHTDVNKWELINVLTRFATHDNGYEISDYDRRRLQLHAGKMLTDDSDLSNFVRNPFRAK